MKKKAEISISMIITIVIVLAVVGILMWIFSDKFTILQKSLNCEESGGICTTECNTEPMIRKGCEEGETCCLEFG